MIMNLRQINLSCCVKPNPNYYFFRFICKALLFLNAYNERNVTENDS